MRRQPRIFPPSTKDAQHRAWETRQRSPEPTERCAIELRLSPTSRDRLLAIAEAGVLGRTVDEVVSHFTREALHRDWLAQEVARARLPAPSVPSPTLPAEPRAAESPTQGMRQSGKRLIRMPEVCNRIGVGRSTLYKMIHAANFPAPKQLGGRTVAWLESDIDAWIDSKQSNPPA